jgi:hypothetical protein
MAQAGFTPVQLYYSATTTNVPTAGNLGYGELAINITDGKLFYKDNANAIQVIGYKLWPMTSVTGTLAVVNGGTGVTTSTGSGANALATSPSLTTPTLTGFTETVYAITDGASVDINPAVGTIQTWTLGANRTPTATSFAAGQSVTLMITSGSFTVTWTTIGVSWIGGVAPTLATGTVKNVIVLWKVGSTVYGSYLGSAS